MNNKKTFRLSVVLILALMLTIVFSISGCSNSDNTDKETGNTEQKTVDSEQDNTQNTDEQQEIELTMWTIDFDPLYEPQNEIAQAFAGENPNIKVKVEKVADYWNKCAAAIAADQVPDVIFWMSRELHPYFVGEKFDKVPSYINLEDTYWPETLQWWKYEEDYYGIPDDYNYEGFPLLMINKTLMQQYNHEIPQAWIDNGGPETFEELTDFAKSITVKNDSGNITVSGLVGFQDTWNSQKFCSLLFQLGAEIGDESSRTVKFNSPEGKQALQFMVDSLKDGGFDDFSLGSGMDQFITNGLAFIGIAAPHWGTKVMIENPDMDWVMLKCPPIFGDTPHFYVDGGWGYSVTQICENKEAAWKLVEYITSKDNAAKVEISAGNVPPRKDLQDSALFIEEEPYASIYKPAFELMPFGKAMPTYILDLGFMNTTQQEQIEKVYAGEKTVEEALADMDELINKHIAEKWAALGK